MDPKSDLIEGLLKELDIAYAENNLLRINEINSNLMKEIGVKVGESSIDFEFINSINGKPVYNNLVKIIENKNLSNKSIAKTLTSLVTHMIIESEVKGVEIDNFPVKNILETVQSLLYNEGFDRGEVVEFLSEKYRKFI